MTCKRRKPELLDDIPEDRVHLIHSKDTYSLRDFVEITKDELLRYTRELAKTFMLHVTQCQVRIRVLPPT